MMMMRWWWWPSAYSAIFGADLLFANPKTMIVKLASDKGILFLSLQVHSIPYFRTLLNVNPWIFAVGVFFLFDSIDLSLKSLKRTFPTSLA
jgi:hypothetical protein